MPRTILPENGFSFGSPLGFHYICFLNEFAMKKKIVVFTGAGVSADSGIATFRDADGLWANYRIEDVCTPEALVHNRDTVIDFYNARRREVLEKAPNAGHRAIAGLEKHFAVEVVTQNIDDLHERAGSTRVTHLHGEIVKLRSSADPELVFPLEGWEQPKDLRASDGALARPHVVFFGEAVPMFEPAARIVSTADVLIIAGTSLAVYPAASLINYARRDADIYVVDPHIPASVGTGVRKIPMRGAEGLPMLAGELIDKYIGCGL